VVSRAVVEQAATYIANRRTKTSREAKEQGWKGKFQKQRALQWQIQQRGAMVVTNAKGTRR
jgi:hypothetical protein